MSLFLEEGVLLLVEECDPVVEFAARMAPSKRVHFKRRPVQQVLGIRQLAAFGAEVGLS